MDQHILQLIDSSIIEILEMPNFVNLSEDQKNKLMHKLQVHFYDLVLDSFIDLLDTQQVSTLLTIPVESPELEQKVIEYSKANPQLQRVLINKFNTEIEKIRDNPMIVLR